MFAQVLLVLTAILCGAAPSPSRASEGVGIVYSVVGVKRGDVLNIRKEPAWTDARSVPIVGTIPFNGTDILGTTLVVRSRGSEWREIVYRGRRGWVNSRFLLRSGSWPDLTKAEFDCLGTEPFWSLQLKDTMAIYTVNESQHGHLGIVSKKAGVNSSQVLLVKLMTQQQRSIVVSIRYLPKQSCTDGMSEHEYGYHAYIEDISDFPDGILDGCCTLKYD